MKIRFSLCVFYYLILSFNEKPATDRPCGNPQRTFVRMTIIIIFNHFISRNLNYAWSTLHVISSRRTNVTVNHNGRIRGEMSTSSGLYSPTEVAFICDISLPNRFIINHANVFPFLFSVFPNVPATPGMPCMGEDSEYKTLFLFEYDLNVEIVSCDLSQTKFV